MAKTRVVVQNQLPAQLEWKRSNIDVTEIADQWSESGRWWADETECVFYLVDTEQGSFLLCQNPMLNEWYAKPVC